MINTKDSALPLQPITGISKIPLVSNQQLSNASIGYNYFLFPMVTFTLLSLQKFAITVDIECERNSAILDLLIGSHFAEFDRDQKVWTCLVSDHQKIQTALASIP